MVLKYSLAHLRKCAGILKSAHLRWQHFFPFNEIALSIHRSRMFHRVPHVQTGIVILAENES